MLATVQNILSSRLLFRNLRILPVILYGCEIRSLTLRENRLSFFENRVLRRIFTPKWDEVTGGWRKLHYQDCHKCYSSPNIIIIMVILIKQRKRWVRYVEF
jgi:hypothetical protein